MLHTFNNEMQSLVLHFQDYRISTDDAINQNLELRWKLIEADKAIAL